MPAIMPPINPNIIAALGQYFGGMQNRTIRTPPFVKQAAWLNGERCSAGQACPLRVCRK